jgi:uncharacterized protein YifE (UPF0438 family)
MQRYEDWYMTEYIVSYYDPIDKKEYTRSFSEIGNYTEYINILKRYKMEYIVLSEDW